VNANKLFWFYVSIHLYIDSTTSASHTACVNAWEVLLGPINSPIIYLNVNLNSFLKFSVAYLISIFLLCTFT